jgi:predicted outer membrane protein
MTRRSLAASIALVLLLASCGADGAPERPEPRPAAGVSVGGSVSAGLSGTL